MAVREALRADVADIARVLIAAWDGAYRVLMPAEIFDVVTYEARLSQWSRFFAEPRPRHGAWVSQDGAEVVGMAHAGPIRDEDLDPATVAELFAIYVDPRLWGQGHGRDLMVATLAGLRQRNYAAVALWVLDTNRRGRDFYEAGGWEPDGEVKVDESFGVPLLEVRYRLDL